MTDKRTPGEWRVKQHGHLGDYLIIAESLGFRAEFIKE